MLAEPMMAVATQCWCRPHSPPQYTSQVARFLSQRLAEVAVTCTHVIARMLTQRLCVALLCTAVGAIPAEPHYYTQLVDHFSVYVCVCDVCVCDVM
jgi:hypothetical protein